ncbi:MAG: DUF4493 domain-containing protein [Bacteroidales bacterium]|jgi:hypothetical protein|nr:DUF4493 domain-containing protein [Bacteroidales bacterium]HPH52776.1 DUF6359 domain-containing protein [Bacteroidales bacterium]
MKRFVLMGVLFSIILASCNMGAFEERQASLSFSFAVPLKTTVTKAVSLPDTNSFILLVKSNTGETLYNGLYGSRPAEIKVPAGTYEVSVRSIEFDKPAFETPQYGDSKVIVVSNGEKVSIAFLCKQLNSGMRFSFSENFLKKYNSGYLLLEQEAGNLEYLFTEQRTAYLKAGNVSICHKSNTGSVPLFCRTLGAGEIHNITLEASAAESASEFTIKVDTTVVYINEKVVIGDEFSGDDGSSAQKAVSVSQAKNRIGDTLWVWGYIIGGDMSSSSVTFVGPFTKDSHIAIAENASEKSRDACFSVELSKTAVKNALNLVANPSNLGRKVFLKGVVVESYFGLNGLKKVSEYSM